MEALLDHSFSVVNKTCWNDTVPITNVFASFDGFSITKWFFSRLRVFFYLSDPYEESFEFVHQVADYHTEVGVFIH